MKLRQKLAVVLASAMVVTAVPVVTMAASTNRLTKETIVVKKDTILTRDPGTSTTTSALKIKFQDALLQSNGQTETFYLELGNSEWALGDATAAGLLGAAANATSGTYSTPIGLVGDALNTPTGTAVVNWEKQSDTIMKLVVTLPANYDAATNEFSKWFSFPLAVKVKEGDATVAISKRGAWSTVTEGKYVFATTGTDKATWSVPAEADVPAFYTKGELATFTLTETFKGSMNNGDSKLLSFQMVIQDGDFEFDGSYKLNLKYGFGSKNVVYLASTDAFPVAPAANTVYIKAVINPDNNKDYGVMQFTVLGLPVTDSLGVAEITNVGVRSTVKDPSEGNLLVDIVNKEGLIGAKDGVVMAKIIKYSNYIKMKDDKAVTIEAGHKGDKIKFKVGEFVDDSIIGDREFEIALDDFTSKDKANAHFDVTFAEGQTEKDVTSWITDQSKASGVTVNGVELLNQNFVSKAVIKKDNPQVIIVTLNPRAQVNEKIDFVEFEAPVCVKLSAKDAGKVMIKASGRALANDCETQAIAIKNPFDVTSTPITVKVGLQGQVGGEVILKETEAGMFDKSGDIKLWIDSESAAHGIYFTDKPAIEVTGDLTKGDFDIVKNSNGTLTIHVKRASKTPSTIKLTGFKVTLDRTVPQGNYDLKIGGLDAKSIDDCDHPLTVKEFFKVGTTNTEDIAANGLRKGTAVFTIGSNKYTANEIEYTMDAGAFLQDPGYTMIPLRYVAYAFGVSEKEILFSNSTATIFAGERTIQLTVGSDIAMVNGAPIKMATKVVLKDGRAYAPIGEVSKLLGIDKGWDSATQTATFTNK